MIVADVSTFRAPQDLDHTPAIMRAVAALKGQPGQVRLPTGRVDLSSTIFLPSGVTVIGAGPDHTLVMFHGQHPDRIASHPRWGILRSSAFVAAGTCPDDAYLAGSQELGDYYVSPPRRLAGFAAAGGRRLVAANLAQLDGVRAGDWIHLWSGPSGWHPALSEMAYVAAIDGVVMTLSAPLDNDYDAGPAGLGAFIQSFDRTGNPPGGARIDLWPHTGFRLLRPVENVMLSDFSIVNEAITPQYGARAYCFVRARQCGVRNVRLMAGEGWHIDCQDITCHVAMRREVSTLPVGVLFNGSNRIDARISSQEGSLLIEEGVQRLTVRESSFELDRASIVIGQYCRDIRLTEIRITNSSSYGISVRKSRDVVINGDIVSAGSAVRYETPPMHAPDITSPAVVPYFDGRSLLLDRCTIRSTRNPGYDLWLQQPIRARGSVLTGKDGAPFLATPGQRHGAIVGSLVRSSDRYQFGKIESD